MQAQQDKVGQAVVAAIQLFIFGRALAFATFIQIVTLDLAEALAEAIQQHPAILVLRVIRVLHQRE